MLKSSWNLNVIKDWSDRVRCYNSLKWVNSDDFMNSLVEFSAPKKHWHVLDVGTGTGKVAMAFSPFVNKVTGIDITPSIIDATRDTFAHVKNLSFIGEDVEDMRFEENLFDSCVARMVFHHVDDCHMGLTEVLRVLKPGSNMVICEGVPQDHLTRPRYEQIFALKEERHTFSEAELINMMDAAGFENIILSPYFMRQVSMNNWLQNSGQPDSNVAEIRRLHVEADDHFKKVYRINEKDGDLFMDWKFIFIKGHKPIS